MTTLMLMIADLGAISFLIFGVYARRHTRRDLIPAYLIINVGLAAVMQVLYSSTAALGVGIGLFGVLSIIRLRSVEIGHREVAYYFAALVLGLLAGAPTSNPENSLALMALVVGIVLIADLPKLCEIRTQTITLNHAVTSESLLREELSGLLDAEIVRITPVQTDVVNDLTRVEVTYR